MLSVLFLGVALAIDSAAVTATLGASRRPMRTLVEAAVLFGLFQGGMSGLGAVGGAWLAVWAAAWDHWVAFVLLLVVGGRMLFGGDEDDEPEDAPETGRMRLLALAVATSIDALGAGVSVPMLGVPLPLALALIAVVTMALSMAAGLAGRRAGTRLGPWVERAGGLVLIGIGVRIVVEHLSAGI